MNGHAQSKTARGRLGPAALIASLIVLVSTCKAPFGLGGQVDTGAPSVEFAAPARNAYVRGSMVVTGSASDDLAVESVVVQALDRAGNMKGEYPAAFADGAWTVSVDTSDGSLDGETVLAAIAKDADGKTGTVRSSVFIDNTPPTVLVTSPLSYGEGKRPRLSDYVDIKGEVYDQSPIARVTVTLLHEDDSVLASQEAEGSATWITRFLLKDQLLDLPDDESIIRYAVEVEDEAGNVSAYYFHRSDIFTLLASGARFPSMTEIGLLDQLGAPDPSPAGISAVELADARLGFGAAPSYGDFIFDYDAKPEVLFTNLDKAALPAANLIGINAPVTGLVIPPPDTGAITNAGFVARLYALPELGTPLYTYVDSDALSDADRVVITALGDSVSFRVDLKDDAGNPVPPGEYRIVVSAQTESGLSSDPVAADFIIDSGAPSLTETALGPGNFYRNQGFTLSGEAADGIGIRDVFVAWSRNGAALQTAPGGALTPPTPAAKNWSWSWASPAPGADMPDGYYEITVTLTTTADKQVVVNRIVTVDTAEPAISFKTPVPYVDGALWTPPRPLVVNGSPLIGAEVSDDSSVQIRRWILPAASAAPAWDDAGSVAWGPPPTSFALDTTALADDAAYKVWALARDRAGNVGSQAQELYVSQATNRPRLSVSLPDVNALTNDENRLGQDPTIQVTISDDDLIDAASLRYRIDANNDGDFNDVIALGTPDNRWGDESIWYSIEDKPANNESLIVARIMLLGFPQGLYRIQIEASDTVGGPESQVQSRAIPFSVDYGPPTISISSPASGSYKDSFVLSGGAADGLGVTSVAYRLVSSDDPDPAYAPIFTGDQSPVAFSETVSLSAYASGEYTLQVRAVDRGGSVANQQIPLSVDRTKPTVSVLTPSAGAVLNGVPTVRGEAQDNRQLGAVFIWHGLASAAAPALPSRTGPGSYDPGGYTQLAGTGIWSSPIDTRAAGIPVADGGAGPEAYRLRAVAVDAIGNVGDPLVVELVADQASDRPTIGFSNLDLVTPSRLGTGARIIGVVEDDDAVHKDKIEIRLDRNGDGDFDDDNEGWVPVSAPPTGDSIVASWYHDITDLALVQGKKHVQVRAQDIYASQTPLAPSWSAADYGWALSPVVEFSIDYGPPTLDIDAPSPGERFTQNQFSVIGTTNDGNGVDYILIWVNDDGIDHLGDGLPDSGETTWIYRTGPATIGSTTSAAAFNGRDADLHLTNDQSEFLINHLISGLSPSPVVKAVQIHSYDTAGAATVRDLSVVIDVVAPTASFNAPTAGMTVNGVVPVSGLANDNYQLAGVYYSVLPVAAAAPAWPGDYDLASGGYAWSFNLDTRSLADGEYLIRILPKDSAGNYPKSGADPAPITRSIIVNQASDRPVLKVLTLAEAGTAVQNLLPSALQVSGTAEDDDSVFAGSVQIRVRPIQEPEAAWGAWADLSGQPLLDTTLAIWSHDFDALGDGRYELQLRAADVNDAGAWGEFSSALSPIVKFSIDLALPVSTISSPAQASFHRQDVTIAGSASDANGVKRVILNLDTGSGYGADIIAYEDLDGDYASPVAWSYLYGVTGANDGQTFYRVTVVDAFDKIRSYEQYFTADTAGPTIGFSQPSAGSTLNGTAVFRGTADDASRVTQVWYKVNNGSGPGVWASPADLSAQGWTQAAGDYSWSFLYKTDALADGAARVYVLAVDAAGNRSDPSLPANQLAFASNQAANLPVVSFSVAENAVLASTAFITGTVTDDDGVDASTIEISFNSTDGLDGDWTPVSDPGGDGLSVNWSHSLAAVPERDLPYAVRVRAYDLGQDFDGVADDFPPVRGVSSPRSVYRDDGPPSLALDEILVAPKYVGDAPVSRTSSFNGSYVHNDFTLFLDAADSSGIDYVQYSLDGTTWLPDGASLPLENAGAGPRYQAALPIASFADGTRTVYFRAADMRGKPSAGSVTLLVDKTEPAIGFLSPAGMLAADAPNVNGDVVIQGGVSDASAVVSLDILGGLSGAQFSLANEGNTVNWKTTLANSSSRANASYAVDQGGNVWRFAVEITARDQAGNRGIRTGYIDIDPDSDRPVVTVLSPAAGGSAAGVFLISGTVADDDGALEVRLQVDLNADGVYGADGGFPGRLDLNGDGDFLDPYEDEAAYATVPVTNGAWSILMNTSGELNRANLAARGLAGASGTIGFKLTPYDIYGAAGAPQSQTVYIDGEAPVIRGLDADGVSVVPAPTPAGGSLLKGQVIVRAVFEDDRDLEFSSMQVSYNGGVSYQNIPGAYISYVAGTENPYRYRVQIPVDTTTAVAGGNGLLNVILKLTDKTFKQTQVSLEYSVDNTRPELMWNVPSTIPFIGSAPSEVYTFRGGPSDADRINQLFGKAIDSGLVAGIGRVDVYFVKGGNILSPRVAGQTLAPTSASLYRSGLDRNGDGDYVDANEYPPAAAPSSVPWTDEAAWVVRIDSRTELGQFDANETLGDQDGFNESLRAKVGYDEWYAFFDTRVLPDGPLQVYFVAYDEAGNASYNLASAQIANNPPRVASVDVGGQLMDDDLDRAKVQGSVGFTMNATDVEGVTVADFKLTVAKRYAVGGGGSIGAEDLGFIPFYYGDQAVYGAIGHKASFTTLSPASGSASAASAQITINTAGGDYPSGYWYLFQAQAKDTDGNLDLREFYVWVNNTDSVAPVVTIDPFTQSSVSGLAGHIEEAGNSPHGDNQADLSGTVKVTGTIYDDTAAQSLTLEISYDGGSTWSALPSPIVGFGAPIGGDVISGYTYRWSYEWNTASISGVAKENLIVRAYGSDGTNTTAAASRPALTVDVVPYITNLSAGLDLGLRSLVRRSALGRYPAAVGAALTVQGYNFNGTSSVVTIGGAPVTVSSGGASSLSLSMAGVDTSGQVIVSVGGVGSLNHLNDNSLPQNKEPNAYNDDLSDDRYVAFWQRESHTARANVQEAVMRPNASRSDFDWMYTQNGKELRLMPNGGTPFLLTQGTGLSGGDFTRNASGSLIFAFNHNNQWTSWEDNYKFVGSIQWGALPSGSAWSYAAGRDEAYNWNLSGAGTSLPRLGLGNASFISASGDNPTAIPAVLSTPYSSYSTLDLNRYKSVRTVAVGGDASTRNYVAYFDQNTQSRAIVFYGFKAGNVSASNLASGNVYTSTAAGAANVTLHGSWFAGIDKYFTASTSDTVALAGTQKNNNTGIWTPRGRMEIGGAGGSTANSEYFDLGVHVVNATTHYGYIAYYDEAAQALKIVYNKGLYTADPLTAGAWAWSAPFTVDSGAGAHVAMAVDPDGGIHLAYQDVESNYLKYSYLTFDGGTNTFTVREQVYVDALIASGQYNAITVRDFDPGAGADYRPVISTYSSAFVGTNVALRVAYPVYGLNHADFGAGASASTGKFSGKWESIAAVASTAPQGTKSFAFTDGASATQGRVHLGYNGAYLEENTYLGLD